MPEYLAPGVYVEEVSFRSKTIEGVPTSTTGFAGMTRWGPVHYVDGGRPGPSTSQPRLITSFTEFERVYGGLERLVLEGGTREGYLAHAARAFFLNGGKRLYVSRVFVPTSTGDLGLASLQRPFGAGDGATWWARWPGAHGEVLLTVRAVRRNNVAFDHLPGGVGPSFGIQARGVTRSALVEVAVAGALPDPDADLDATALRVVEVDPTTVDADGLARQSFLDDTGATVAPPAGAVIREVVLRVIVQSSAGVPSVYGDLAVHPAQRRWIAKILQADDPEDEDAMVFLGTDADDDPARAIGLALALQTPREGARLDGGADGAEAQPADLGGREADLDRPAVPATGLHALGEIDDIAIVALPDAGAYDDVDVSADAAGVLVGHAEAKRYRIAVVDPPIGQSMNQVRSFRGRFDSTRAAMYHPWIEVFDPLERPTQGAPPRRLLLPPSGFVTGIYARNDITRGVFKAPANEVVMGLTRFEANINTARNDVLNPEGINALRFFEGRGNRVWGARTMTSDPEWKYVNVRRLFIYLEHSIDEAMQWAVFEPNNERLWGNIRRTVEDFLYVQWLNGALLGAKPDEAYFVRCDRTTMTQNDLDNGRLICLIGVAPTKPAEYVIFRIGQWTADSACDAPREEMTHATQRNNPYPAFNYLVGLGGTQGSGDEGQVVGGFSDVSGLGFEVQYADYRNGNEKVNTVRKVQNTFTVEDVVLKRGLIGSTDLFAWLQDVREGGIDPRVITVTLLDEARNPVATWKLLNAQPKKWTGPTLAAKGGTEVAMEELTLCHEGIEYS